MKMLSCLTTSSVVWLYYICKMCLKFVHIIKKILTYCKSDAGIIVKINSIKRLFLKRNMTIKIMYYMYT